MIFVHDEREIWHAAIIAAAERAGHRGKRVFSGEAYEDAKPGDIGFLRPHADWRVLPKNRDDYSRMLASGLLTIQDQGQVDTYELKSDQFLRWGHLMPDTWLIFNEGMALSFLEHAPIPLVSKSDVGASSTNVRILYTKEEAQKHVAQIFGHGILVNHGANCPMTRQKDYVLFQRFIPHETTFRVNAIGNARAVFFRRNYPNKPVAQTGNVSPAFEMDDELDSLLEYSDRVFAAIGSKWCALDILKDVDGSWKLLETSLAWPWPSPGECNRGTIFRSKGRKWIEMFDVMFDELERGAWAN